MAAIIVYFSRSGENYVSGAIRDLKVGNTEVIAKMLHDLTGAALFRLEMQQEYAWSYNDCIAQAQADLRRDARPALKALMPDLAAYDTIYLGFPNYWGTMPMCVFTFLEQLDGSAKRIKPFCTHEGSGFGNSLADIRRLCPTAELCPGFAVRGANVKKAEAALREWCAQLQGSEESGQCQ